MTIKKPYFNNLNGLRFMAFFAVFVSHIFAFRTYKIESPVAVNVIDRFLSNGDLGVSFFFVLSGFLISTLLIHEAQLTGTISIKNFYWRRVLRIWPVYFFILLLGFFMIPYFVGSTNTSGLSFQINPPAEQLPWYLLFGANFYIVNHYTNYLLVAVLWSVSVEEQFYLIWPWVTNKFGTRGLIVIIVLLLAVSFVYRVVNYRNTFIIEYSTFSVMNDLLLGSLFAVLDCTQHRIKYFFASLPKWKITAVYVLLFAGIGARLSIYELPQYLTQYAVATEPLVFSLLFVFIILEQNYSQHSLFKIGNYKRLNYLGKISYGLYCYHMICLFFTGILFHNVFNNALVDSPWLFALQAMVTLCLTIVFAAVSYTWMEARFLLLKQKFS